jgi:hypothetical protein
MKTENSVSESTSRKNQDLPKFQQWKTNQTSMEKSNGSRATHPPHPSQNCAEHKIKMFATGHKVMKIDIKLNHVDN